MARNSTISVQITGDATKLKRALSDAESRLSRFGGAMKGLAKTAGLAFGGLAAGAVIAAPKILELGAELDAMAAKAAVVFEDSLGSVRKWAEANAAAMGMTTEQLVAVAAGTADLLKPMGLSAEAAANMAMQTNDLAGALSAWTGGQRSAAEVSEILTKAYLGERDGLKALGISISEADVQARLLANGQQDLTGAQLEQAKALATQQLIMEKSVDAQTAWADGSMDAVKAQNETRASIERVKESFVKALAPAIEAVLPYVEKLATWMADNLPKAIEKVKSFVENDWPKIRDTIVETVQNIWDVVGPIWDAIYQIVEGTITSIRGVIETVTSLIRGDWEGVWNGIRDIISGAWESIKGVVTGSLEVINIAIAGVTAAIAYVWNAFWSGVKTFVSNTWDDIKGVVSGAIDAIVGFFAGIYDRVMAVASNMFGPAIEAAEVMIAVLKEIVEWVERALDALGKLNPANYNNLDSGLVLAASGGGSGIAGLVGAGSSGGGGGTGGGSFQSRPVVVNNTTNVDARNSTSADQIVAAIERQRRLDQ